MKRKITGVSPKSSLDSARSALDELTGSYWDKNIYDYKKIYVSEDFEKCFISDYKGDAAIVLY